MKQRIEIVRGTTNTFHINIADANGAPYTLGSGERVVFGIKSKPESEELLVVKVGEILYEGTYVVKLCPEDTAALPCGKYSYDVGLDTAEDFFNVIEPSPFDIVASVTTRGCGC